MRGLATSRGLARVEGSSKTTRRPIHQEKAQERLRPMGEETRAAVRAVETLERKDRVLIVEDEDNARKGYEQLLQRWGYDVLGVASSARKGYEQLLQRRGYDVLGVASAEEVLAKFASYHRD